jgi:hypothetical protein
LRDCIAADATPSLARAGYLDENPEEVFSTAYERLGALPLPAARDPYVWLRLEELKLDKLGYRREAAERLYRFVRNCGAPLNASTVPPTSN